MTALRATAALAAALPLAIAASAQPAPLAERIDAYLAPYLEDGHLSGNLIVADRGRVLYERAFGMANHELGVPNGPETRHCVASITKPMTLVALARLIEMDRLAKDDRLSRWLPDFPRGDDITVAMLSSHRAGIPHRLIEGEAAVRPMTAQDMVEIAARSKLTFEPGSDSSYSSGGFSVLARVLELAGGKSYQELLEEHVLGPAGMSATAHVDARTVVPGRASSYYIDGRGRLTNTAPRDNSYLIGAGSVFSTARDLIAMMRTLTAGGFGELATSRLMREEGVRWNGVTHGFRAFADYHAGTGIYIAFTSNLQTGAGNLVRRDLPKLAAGEEVATREPLGLRWVELPAAALARYEGAYQLRPGRNIDLRVIDGSLHANEWLLIPLSETRFFSIQDYAHITVVLDESGAVERLDWEIQGEIYPMPRVGEPAPAEGS